MEDIQGFSRMLLLAAEIQEWVHRNPIKESFSRTDVPLLRKSALQKRFYFKNREYDQGKWFHNSKRVVFTTFFFSCGVVVAVSSGDWVTVPYTGRTPFIPFKKFIRSMMPDKFLVLSGEDLPHLHPDSIMARRIFQDIMDQAFPLEMENEGKRKINFSFHYGDIEKVDEKQGEEKDECGVIVVDSNEGQAGSPGRFGKIYVTSALLHHYRECEEIIATIFGHEVGHDLARHTEERVSKIISTVPVIGMSLYLFCQSCYIRSKMPFLVKLMRIRFLPSFSFVVTVVLLSYLLLLKYYRELELEADHIGLMLASSAGYDPEVGALYPLYKVEMEPGDESMLEEWFSSVPSIGDQKSIS